MTQTKELLIALEDVSKSYQKQSVLERVDLAIYRGDAIALLGPNGCGKSTLMKIIGQLLPVTSGKVRYQTPLKLGYVAADFPDSLVTPETLFNQLMAIDLLPDSHARMTELVEKFGISQMLKTPISYLSKGSKQKINVIQALLCQPDILLLDEPLSGQDLASQADFIELMQKLNREGTTLVICCHESFLTEALAKDVYQVIDKGLRLKAHQALKTERNIYAVILTDPLGRQRDSFIEAIQGFTQMIEESATDCQLVCSIPQSQQLLALCVAHQIPVRRLTHEFI